MKNIKLFMLIHLGDTMYIQKKEWGEAQKVTTPL